MNKKIARVAMLNRQSQKNRQYPGEYSQNQIGFRHNENRNPEYRYDNRVELQPMWNEARMQQYDRNDVQQNYRNDCQQPYSNYDNMMTYDEKQNNVVPMQGYLGISYAMENHNNMEKMDKKQAENWTRHMKNGDGSTGARWTFDEIQKIMQQHNVDCNPIEFYAAMNMMYSDYGKVFQKHDAATVPFYVDMTKAFLDDDDAVKDKLEQYYKYIVKH